MNPCFLYVEPPDPATVAIAHRQAARQAEIAARHAARERARELEAMAALIRDRERRAAGMSWALRSSWKAQIEEMA